MMMELEPWRCVKEYFNKIVLDRFAKRRDKLVVIVN